MLFYYTENEDVDCQSNKSLLITMKIIKFALFLCLSGLLVTGFAAESTMRKDNYLFIFNERDSILAEKLYTSIEKPLHYIEQFFDRKAKSTITIYLTKSETEYQRYARRKVPEWSQAVAFPSERLIVIKLAGAEEINTAPEILLHELVHIFIAGRIPENRMPTWLNEGLAQYLSGKKLTITEKVGLANALASNKIFELSALDTLLRFNPPEAQLAYSQALTAVEFFIKKHGEAKLNRLVNNLAVHRSINDAFLATVGYDFIDFKIFWYEDLNDRYRWLILLNLDNLIWILISVLAISAIIAIRLRNRKKLKTWDETESEFEI